MWFPVDSSKCSLLDPLWLQFPVGKLSMENLGRRAAESLKRPQSLSMKSVLLVAALDPGADSGG